MSNMHPDTLKKFEEEIPCQNNKAREELKDKFNHELAGSCGCKNCNILTFISKHTIDKQILKEKIEGMRKFECEHFGHSPGEEVDCELDKRYNQAFSDLSKSLDL